MRATSKCMALWIDGRAETEKKSREEKREMEVAVVHAAIPNQTFIVVEIFRCLPSTHTGDSLTHTHTESNVIPTKRQYTRCTFVRTAMPRYKKYHNFLRYYFYGTALLSLHRRYPVVLCLFLSLKHFAPSFFSSLLINMHFCRWRTLHTYAVQPEQYICLFNVASSRRSTD